MHYDTTNMIYREGQIYSNSEMSLRELKRVVIVFKYPNHYVIEMKVFDPKNAEDRFIHEAGEYAPTTFADTEYATFDSHYQDSQIIRAAIQWFDTGELPEIN